MSTDTSLLLKENLNFFKKEIVKDGYINFEAHSVNFVNELSYLITNLKYLDPSEKLKALFTTYSKFNYDYNDIFQKFKNSLHRISVVMTHKNRPELLFLTLVSIAQSKSKNLEVIIVDDNSDADRLPTFLKCVKFPFLIKYLPLHNPHTVTKNPSKGYNYGFEHVNGDIVLIQNSECMHLGDIITYVNNNFNYDNYLSFPCYSSNNKKLNNYIFENLSKLTIDNIEQVTHTMNIEESVNNYTLWYQHPVILDKNYHFCAAISLNYLKILNGFGPLYYDGIAFDDDDFVTGIKNLKLNIVSVKTSSLVGVVHQHHGNRASPLIPASLLTKPLGPNTIYWDAAIQKHTLNEKIHAQMEAHGSFYIPKIIHYYCNDFTNFNYYNYVSLLSAIHHHPEWTHILWSSKTVSENISYTDLPKKSFIDPNVNTYIRHLKTLHNLRFFTINEKFCFNIPEDMSDIHKKDMMSYKLIHTFGGIWSDLEILYINKISNLIKEDFDNLIFKCKDNSNQIFFPTGFLCSKRKSKFLTEIVGTLDSFYDKTISSCLGPDMLFKKFNNTVDLKNLYGEKNIILGNDFYMPYLWYESDIQKLFNQNNNLVNEINLGKTIGIYWFNSSPIVQKYLTNCNSYPNLINSFAELIHRKWQVIITDFQSLSLQNSQDQTTIKTCYYNTCKSFVQTTMVKIDLPVKNSLNDALLKERFNTKNKNILYIFGDLDYEYFMTNYQNQKSTVVNLIDNLNYIVYVSGIFIDKTLKQFNQLIFDNSFAVHFFQKAKKVIISDTKNKIHLLENNILNNQITYHPIVGYSILNKIIPIVPENQIIDVLILTKPNESYPYQKEKIEKIKNYCQKENLKFAQADYTCAQILHENTILSKSKVVILVPPIQFRKMPWKKMVSLMSKKVFFLMEENIEIYNRNMQNLIVFYLKDNIQDLFEKLSKFVQNKELRNKTIVNYFNFVSEEYNFDKNMQDIVSTL